MDLVPDDKPDVYAEAIKAQMGLWTRTGVTAIMTTWGGGNIPEPALTSFSRLDRRDELPLRLAWSSNPELELQTGSHFNRGSDYLFNVGASFEVANVGQGTAESHFPWLFTDEPDLGHARYLPSTLTPVDDRLATIQYQMNRAGNRAESAEPQRESIITFLKKGMPISDMHSYGDLALDQHVSIFEQAVEETDLTVEDVRESQRIQLSHIPLIRPDQINDIKKWGLFPGPSWRVFGEFIDYREMYGDKIDEWAWPIRSLLDAGIDVPSNIDGPPTFGENGETIWAMLKFYVTREHRGITLNPDEAVNRWEALETVTTMGARNIWREDQLGSLEVGKKADLAVLNKDYFEIPADEIGTILPETTIVGGDVVYS